jgi:crossover junction endodeoxyribonuclease RuvC
MIVIGIDPGLAATGFGVVASGAPSRAPSARTAECRAVGGLVAVGAGVISTHAQASAESRLAEIHAEVEALLLEHRPDAMALEELYFGQNARTAFAVGQGRAAAMLAAGQRGVPCASYTPQQVKAAVCGSGAARKEQVSRMVATLLGTRGQQLPDHASDALAVAICHANRAPLARALETAAP